MDYWAYGGEGVPNDVWWMILFFPFILLHHRFHCTIIIAMSSSKQGHFPGFTQELLGFSPYVGDDGGERRRVVESVVTLDVDGYDVDCWV